MHAPKLLLGQFPSLTALTYRVDASREFRVRFPKPDMACLFAMREGRSSCGSAIFREIFECLLFGVETAVPCIYRTEKRNRR
jgi:hypothetical protein